MASQSTFVLKADTSSFLKSIQEAQTRLLGIEKEASTSYQQILAAQAEVNRLQASQSDLGKLKATIDATSKARIAELSVLQTNADNERKKSLNEMIRLERALAASDKAKISEYMAGLQATEKGLQNQIKGLQLANAALKQNANEIQNINNKQAEQSVYAKKNIDAVKARQALLQKEIALEQEKLNLAKQSAVVASNAASNAGLGYARNADLKAAMQSAYQSPEKQSVSPAIPLIAATATQNIKPIDSSSIIRFREETQKATEAIREQTKATSLADEGFARLNRSFQGFAAGYLGFSALLGQTKEIVDASVKFDTLNKIFTAITGSGEVAAAEMDMVKEAADRLGVPVLKSAQGLKGLLAVGLTLQEPMANLNQQFVALSQAAVSFGMGEVEVERAFKAYTQILSKDKLMAEELTGQLAEAIPGAVGIMAKALGYVTKTGLPDTAKLFKEMEKGAIDGSDALNKFSVELKKVTDAMVPTAAQSARAEFTRLQNSLLELRATIGESGLLEMLADLAKVGTSVFSGIDTKDIADLTTHIKVLGSVVGILLVANFLKAKESATAFSGALKDVAHSVVSGMDIQTKATLQTANANNVLLSSTKPLTASQIALRNEITALSGMGVTATNKITAYNQSVASVGRASAIATSATNLLSTSLRGVAAAASFAWPIAAIMAATTIYNHLSESVDDARKSLEQLADDQSWGQLASKIAELQESLGYGERDTGISSIFTGIMSGINNVKKAMGEDFFSFFTPERYRDALQKANTKTLDVTREGMVDLINESQKMLDQVKQANGAGAEQAALTLKSYVKKAKIGKNFIGGQENEDLRAMGDLLVKNQKELEDIDQKNKAKLKSKKPDGKDLSSALIKSAKSEFEAIKEMSETAFKQMEMLNELPTADLEMYKSLAKVQLEILQNEKEISILRAAKDDKGDKAIEIKALLDKNKALKQSEESIYKINQITKEKATNEYLAANATELQIPIIKEAMDIQKAYEKALLDGVDATVALTIANDKWAKSYASNDFSKMQSLLEIQKEIAEVTLRGREKDRELENIRHLEAINNLEKEKSQLSAMDKESIDRINLRIALENERYKQNTDLTIRYMNIAFDTLEKNIDDTLFNVLTGKFEDFGETIKNIFADVATQIAKDLTGSIASSITGGLKSIASEMLGFGGSGGSGGSLFNVGLAELTSSTPSFSSFEDFTNWANANGAGVDTKLLAQATELAQGGNLSGAANLLGSLSNAQSLATLPSKAKNLLAFASDPSGYFTTLGSTTGGFLGNVSTGFGGWLGGYTAPAANSAMGLGYYVGGALAGAGGGYLLGSLGDRLFGKQTQAGNFGAIGGTIGAVVGGPVGAVIGAGIGSVVGGMFGGGKKYTGGGSQIILANKNNYSWTADGANVSGNFGDLTRGNVAGWNMSWQDWKKSGGWFSGGSSGTETSISGMSSAELRAINSTFASYEAILRGLGDMDALVAKGGVYSSLQTFLDDGLGTALIGNLMDSTDTAQINEVYNQWKEYADANKKSVREALTEGLNGAISFMLDFSLLNAQLSGGNVLKLKAQQTADALDTTQEVLGIFGVSVANFSAQMQSAIKENATPETIQNWEALGTALQAAAEAQKAYQDAINAINKTFIAAANEITGAGKKTFDQLSAMTPTMDNYNELIGMLRETRQADIDTLTTISQKRIESLEKEKAFIVDMSEIAKELNSRIFEGAPANNVLFKTELAKAKQDIAAGQLPDTSILAKTANEYLDTYAKFSKSREDYIFEVAKVRSELGGIKTKESTIGDVEAAIKKEEETLKSAIDNLNSTALKILESWRGTLIGNEGAIRDVIGGSGMVNVINMAPLVPFADGGIVTSATNALIGEAGYPEAIIPLKDGNGLKVDISGLTPLLEELITKQGATEQTMNRIKTLLERVARLDKGAISVIQAA